MTATVLRFAASLMAVGVLSAATVGATSYGVFVDGSYSPGQENSEMDQLIDQRLADSDRIMGQRDPGSRRTTVHTKDALRTALQGIRCTCQDTITVVMMGHGTEDNFIFSKARRRRDRRLGAEDLADWLEGAAVECCCKIHVVIFSCHSGSFLDELFEQEHIESVYASSQAGERSYSDAHWLEDRSLFDGGDWLEGFNEDWESAPARASVADALQESSESAEEKMPDRFVGSQHPQGWRRGRLPVVAHVERPPRRGKLRIHYHQPEFLRSTTSDLEVEGVDMPDDVEQSNWVTFTGEFGQPGDPVRPVGGITLTEPPQERILAHVEDLRRRRGRRYLRVHTVRPKWLNCKKQRLYLDDTSQLPEGLGPCKWIEQDVTLEDPEDTMHTGERVNQATPTFPAKVHVSGTINHQRGTFRGHILEPRWLSCRNYDIQLPPAERAMLRTLRSCRNVLIDLDLPSVTERILPGRNLRLIHRTAGSWSPQTDTALHAPNPLDYSLGPTEESETRTVAPTVGVTNVGQDTVSFAVLGIIGQAEDAEELRHWLEDSTTKTDALWTGEILVERLEPAATADVEFEAWEPPAEGGSYWAGFRTLLPGDENPASDSTGLFFDVPTETAEDALPSQQDDLQLLDLGTLAPGRYNFPITARNESCKGKHTAKVSFEVEAPRTETPWLQIIGPDTLEKIPTGGEKSTEAVVDLQGLEFGQYSGILRVTCTTCPPPPLCVQDFAAVRIRVAVGEP